MSKETKQQTGLQIMQAPEVTDLIEKNKFDLTKAEAYATGYAPLMSEVREQVAIIKKLDKLKPEDAAVAKRASLDLGKICSKLESKKKEDKAILLVETRLIDGLFNVAESTARLGQADAKEIFEYQERIEAEARLKLKESRIALLAPFETDTEFLPLDTMDEDKFQSLLSKEKESFEAVKAKREQDEKDRIEAERIEEEKRLAEIEAEKVRQAERDAENERLKKEAEAREKELEKERIEREKQLESEREESAKIAAEKQKEIDALKAKQDAIELAEQAEKQRIIDEENDRIAKEKAALLAPDKEKVRIFFDQFTALAFPNLESDAGKEMTREVQEAITIVKQLIIKHSKNLL